MQKTTYNIALWTPLGIRNGTMDIQIHGKTADGVMHLLNRSEPFRGLIEEGGRCSFTGKLVTLMRTIPYRAVGQIQNGNVDLSLMGDKESFHLTGEVCE